MSTQSILFIGTESEVGHHAAPLLKRMPNVSIVAPEEALKIAQPADLAIFYSEHFDRFRNTCVELKARGVATLYLIDGILEWRNAWENRPDEPACPWTMRPVLSDKVACIGQSQARVLRGWGNGPKIEVVGIPRLDELAPQESKETNPRIESSPFRLLVMTAKWPGFTESQIANTVRGLVDLKLEIDLWSKATGREVLVTWRLTQGIEEQVGVANSTGDLRGSELANTLTEIDAVITTPSTAMLEAMLMELPVAVLEYNNTPQYVPAAWQITSRNHVQDVLTQLNAPLERRVFLQRTILEDALACDGKACDRLEELVKLMLRNAKTNLGMDSRSRFPTNMLAGESTNESQLPHAKVFDSQEEFALSNKVELQSQLAHSRREIEHLQSVVSQLQSELDEAHTIFNQIHDHPIAGPIVRVRQRFADWLQRFKTRTSANETVQTDTKAETPLVTTPTSNTRT